MTQPNLRRRRGAGACGGSGGPGHGGAGGWGPGRGGCAGSPDGVGAGRAGPCPDHPLLGPRGSNGAPGRGGGPVTLDSRRLHSLGGGRERAKETSYDSGQPRLPRQRTVT